MSKIKDVKRESKPVGGLAWILANKILFILHTFLYVAVTGLLIVIWAVTFDPVSAAVSQAVPEGAQQMASAAALFWPIIPILGWLIGYGFHAVTYLMYNDKIEYLANVRRVSLFGILFIYHAWFFASVNLLLIVINVSIISEPFFTWPLLIWGIGFGIHAVGFFTWDIMMQKEISNLKRVKPEFSENQAIYVSRLKIMQIWLLLANVAYLIGTIILIYTRPLWGLEINYYVNGVLIDPIINLIPWMILVGVHALSFLLFNYMRSINGIKSSLILDMVAYAAFNIYYIIVQVTLPELVSRQLEIWVHYPLILWGIVLAVHIVVMLKWDMFLPSATEKIKGPSTEGFEDFQLKRKAIILLFWQWTFIAHICVYIAGIILLSVDLTALGLSDVIIHVIMGWLIGLTIHSACFVIILKKIKGFLTWTAILHIAAYIPTCVYLVLINVLIAPGILWSVIAIAGWGIGLGLHVLLAYLAKNR